MVGHRIKHIVQETNTQNTTDYTYDANNRMTSTTTTANGEVTGTTRYYYDNNGNTIAEQQKNYTTGNEQSDMSLSGRIGTSTAKIYKYDAFNRLVQFNEGATEATYTYSADNLRNSKTVNGTRTDFAWNGQNLASETKNDITTTYTYDPTGIALTNDGTDTVRFIKDPHGNVVATSKNNSITDSYDYTAFGVQLNSAETSNPFRYCGEYYDEELDSIYLRNRYYQPTIGRFINEDPVKDGLNRYNYCAGNPVMMVDPSGLIKVMMRYVIEKNGGDVEWNEYTQTAKVTMNVEGNVVVKEYSGEIINGRMVVDSKQLSDDFGISEKRFKHKKNDVFYSVEDAAMAFGLSYNLKSIDEESEYGCTIYKKNEDEYSFDDIIKGDDEGVTHEFNDERLAVAVVHTHGAYAVFDENDTINRSYGNDVFSVGDAVSATKYNVPVYLITPGGNFMSVRPGYVAKEGESMVAPFLDNNYITYYAMGKMPKQTYSIH